MRQTKLHAPACFDDRRKINRIGLGGGAEAPGAEKRRV
jgi:hypothetical protein